MPTYQEVIMYDRGVQTLVLIPISEEELYQLAKEDEILVSPNHVEESKDV